MTTTPAESVGCCLASSLEECRRPPCPCNFDTEDHTMNSHGRTIADVASALSSALGFEVTDEMVERARSAYIAACNEDRSDPDSLGTCIRAALAAAFDENGERA